MPNSLRDNGSYVGVDASVTYDPYWGWCKLAVPMDGTSGSTTFTDISPSNRGTATVSGASVTTTSTKFYGAALSIPSNGGYLRYSSSSDFDFNPWDFTICMWIYPTGGQEGTQNAVFSTNDPGNTGMDLWMFQGSDPATLRWDWNGSVGAGGSLAAALKLNSWNYLHVGRSGSTAYLNSWNSAGVATSSYLTAVSIPSGARAFTLMNSPYDNGRTIRGMATDLRVYNGVYIPFPTAMPAHSLRTYARGRPSGIYVL